jgi:hypothetical protein
MPSVVAAARLRCRRYDANGVALLRPIAPGEPLWPELLQRGPAQAWPRLEAAAAGAGSQACGRLGRAGRWSHG